MAKTATKKAAPKKAAKKAVKKAAPKKTVSTDFNWTDDKKAQAHAELLTKYNRHEPERRATLNVEYLPDGTAQVRGKVKHVYKIKL